MNQREDSTAMRFLAVLVAGFSLLIALLATSAWVGITTIRSAEETANLLVQQQTATLRLIEDIQQEQDSLSEIFYSLAIDQGQKNREVALRELEKLEVSIGATLKAGLSSARPEYWSDVGAAVTAFVAEGHAVIRSGDRPGPNFFRTHESLIAALGKLAALNFDQAAAAQKRQVDEARERVRSSLFLLGAALLTAILGAVLTVWIVTRMYRQLQWQGSELSHLSSRTMADQEETARRFSRELHDEFGQTLNAIEATLVAMSNSRSYDPVRMEDALALIKDAIGNARDLSQLMRPSILDDFGLDASLRWLAEGFSARNGIPVEYVSTGQQRVSDEIETQLFRIAQEALTNVARHAQATYIRMELERNGGTLALEITDNGKGIIPSRNGDGLGLVGMRARLRAVAGTLTVSSSPGKGVTVRAEVPAQEIVNAA